VTSTNHIRQSIESDLRDVGTAEAAQRAMDEQGNRSGDDLRAEQLRELAAIVESSDDAILSKDLDGTIRSWNAGAERLYGYSRDEAIGRPITMLAPPHLKDEISRIIEQIRRGERVDHFETLRRRKDGREVYVSLTVSPVRDHDGTIFAASVIARDVTERRQMESALQVSERQLQAALVEAEKARREAEQLATRLQDVDAVIDVAFAHSSFEDLLRGLLLHIDNRLKSDATMILLVDEHRVFEQRLAVGFVDPRTYAVFATVAKSLTHRVVERHQPIVLENTTGLGDPTIPGSGVQSVVGVPLLVQGQLIGALCTGQRTQRIFTKDEVQLLRLVADRAAVAIDNARIYQKTHSVAETLQRSLLPRRLPSSEVFKIAALYLPAMHGMEVGGDWYDATELPNARIALTVGDVVGHGIEAAAAMGQLRNALRAYLLEGHSPSSAIEQLNNVNVLGDDEMATLVCIVVDPTTLTARFASAGHPPPLIVRRDGDAAYLDGGRSAPLGAPPPPKYPEGEMTLEPGSTLFLYTDGLVERPGASIDAGLDRLREAACATRGDVDTILPQIVDKLLGDERRRDDVAMMALKVAQEA
jgi:PAS domain S-box-containing protein